MDTPSIDTNFQERATKAAKELEVRFVSEFLKSSGFDDIYKTFSGGPGEQHFSSFLREKHAEAIVNAGGFGLSEMFFEQMAEHEKMNK